MAICSTQRLFTRNEGNTRDEGNNENREIIKKLARSFTHTIGDEKRFDRK